MSSRFTRSKYIVAAGTVGLLVGIPTAGAAVHHLITGADVKNGSLTSLDVKNRSLHALDFDKKVQAALKLRAQRGLTGATGLQGALLALAQNQGGLKTGKAALQVLPNGAAVAAALLDAAPESHVQVIYILELIFEAASRMEAREARAVLAQAIALLH